MLRSKKIEKHTHNIAQLKYQAKFRKSPKSTTMKTHQHNIHFYLWQHKKGQINKNQQTVSYLNKFKHKIQTAQHSND